MSALDIFEDAVKRDNVPVTRYRARLQLRNVIVGGVPSSPSVIRGWLRKRMELGDEALEEMARATFADREFPGWESVDDAVDALMASDLSPNINGFKRIPGTGELAYEARQMKAALKEWSNSAYPGWDWDGKKIGTKPGRSGNKVDVWAKGVAPKKGLESTLAERVFLEGLYIGLGVKDEEVSQKPDEGPAWVEERIKHFKDAKGNKLSAINRVEVVYQPCIEITLKVHDDFLTREAWARIWTRGEDVGIGAERGRSDGQFDLVEWAKL